MFLVMHQALAGACSLISLSMICTSRSEQPESAAPMKNGIWSPNSTHSQPPSAGTKMAAIWLMVLSHGHGRGDVLRFGYLLKKVHGRAMEKLNTM